MLMSHEQLKYLILHCGIMENNVIHQICNFYDHGKWNGGFSGYVSCVLRYKFRTNIENEKLKVHSGRGYHIRIYTDLW